MNKTYIPEDDPDADTDLPADSAASLRDIIEGEEDADLNEAERKDQIP